MKCQLWPPMDALPLGAKVFQQKSTRDYEQVEHFSMEPIIPYLFDGLNSEFHN